MPNYIKPVERLTQEQIKAMLERIITRKAPSKPPVPKMSGEPKIPGMDPSMARASLGQPAPVTKEYGQLLDTMNSDKPITRTLPIDDAMQQYIGDPMRFKALPVGPPAEHAYPITRVRGAVPQEMRDPADMGMGIARERMVFKNPLPQNMRRTQGVINDELLGGNVPRGPAEQFEQMIKRKEQGVPKIEGEQVGSILALTGRLEDLWQANGGARSGMGGLWKAYWQGSNLKDKIKNPKDYFVTLAVRYHNNPETFGTIAPREKNLLDKMKTAYREKLGIDLDTGKPVSPAE